jgi:hypothetical protein
MAKTLAGVLAILIAALLFAAVLVSCSSSSDVSKECKEVFDRQLQIVRTTSTGDRKRLEGETRTVFECRTSNEWIAQFKEYQSKRDDVILSDDFVKLNLGNICRNAGMEGSACRDSDGIPVPTIQPR